MIMGIFAIVAFNLADTYFVSKLGTNELAAMGFIFPVVMLLAGIALGLGVGASSVISRAIGEGDDRRVRRLTTDSLILALLIVILFAVAGLATMNPLFRLLGATPEILPLIRQYMTIWYVGMVFVVVPMVGNNAIRAAGDTKTPGLIMLTAAVVNVILDPLLIFGLAGLPRLGIAGAALATVFARATTLCISLSVLHFRYRMLDFSLPRLRAVWDSWKKILYVGMPAAGTNTMVPISTGVITRLAAEFGPAAVAATGVGMKVERFALLVVMALSTILVPFIGQNWGAGKLGRVNLTQRYSYAFSFLWGILSVGVLLICAGPIAGSFSRNPDVVRIITLYLWIVPAGYGMQGICWLASASLNGINKPLISISLHVIRVFVLLIPLAWIGSQFFEMKGLLAGICIANVFAGIVSLIWVRRTLKNAWLKKA